MKSNSIIAIIPAYNESATIKQVVQSVRHYVDLVVVIDDASTDDTAVQAAGKSTIVLTHPINLGQGAALQTGFDYVKKMNPPP
jgi:glycosyltransferase involved in cell wall biosynthesis